MRALVNEQQIVLRSGLRLFFLFFFFQQTVCNVLGEGTEVPLQLPSLEGQRLLLNGGHARD